MNATILHESRGRIRFRLRQKQMTLAQADLLEAWIQGKSWCRQVTVHERTCCVILYYDGTRQAVLNEIRHFSWQEAERTTALPAHSTRALNREFEEKLVTKVVCKAACTLFLPPPLRIARILWHMIPFVRRGLRCLLRRRIKVELLDALSISHFLPAEGTSEPPEWSCFCWRWASCWRSGQGRNPWRIWPGACR